jgi:spore coat polysaccharide biosynthesis protein SpsF
VTTVAIIQVRLGSTRLPHKALQPIGNLPSFAHVFYRVKEAVPNTFVACPDYDETELRNVCTGAHIISTQYEERPDCNELITRYYLTAKWAKADTIVRVTGDCIFTSPAEIRRVLSLYDGTYAENEPSTLPYHGMECQVFSMEALTDAYENATDNYDREHTVPYMRRKYGYGESTGPDSTVYRAKRRMVLDTAEDLAWFQSVAEVLNVTPPATDVATLLAAIDAGIIPTPPENEVQQNA